MSSGSKRMDRAAASRTRAQDERPPSHVSDRRTYKRGGEPSASTRFELRLQGHQLALWRAIAARRGQSVADLVRDAVAQLATPDELAQFGDPGRAALASLIAEYRGAMSSPRAVAEVAAYVQDAPAITAEPIAKPAPHDAIDGAPVDELDALDAWQVGDLDAWGNT